MKIKVTLTESEIKNIIKEHLQKNFSSVGDIEFTLYTETCTNMNFEVYNMVELFSATTQVELKK